MTVTSARARQGDALVGAKSLNRAGYHGPAPCRPWTKLLEARLASQSQEMRTRALDPGDRCSPRPWDKRRGRLLRSRNELSRLSYRSLSLNQVNSPDLSGRLLAVMGTNTSGSNGLHGRLLTSPEMVGIEARTDQKPFVRAASGLNSLQEEAAVMRQGF